MTYWDNSVVAYNFLATMYRLLCIYQSDKEMLHRPNLQVVRRG